MNPAGESCATCRFAASVQLPGTKAAALVCRRNPPIPLAMTVMVAPSPSNPNGGIATNVTGYQAPVTAETWCGEWRAKSIA